MTNQVAKQQKEIMQKAEDKIKNIKDEGLIKFPANYDPFGALRKAYYILKDTKTKDKKPVLEACSSSSVINTLTEMVIKGYNPMKKHCAFVPRGTELTLQDQYEGKILQARRNAGLVKWPTQIVWNNDEFEYHYEPNTGDLVIDKHNSGLANVGDKLDDIKGAYCVLIFESGHVHRELMTREQIRTAWNQGDMKGGSPAHKNFPDQMAKRSVINRALKWFIESSDDSDLDFGTQANASYYEQQEEAPEIDVTDQTSEVDEAQSEAEAVDVNDNEKSE